MDIGKCIPFRGQKASGKNPERKDREMVLNWTCGF